MVSLEKELLNLAIKSDETLNTAIGECYIDILRYLVSDMGRK